jgi:membrane protein required for colicin V production
MDWNVFDIVFGIIILFLALRGVLRGFIGEVFSLGAIVVGIGAAVLFSSLFAGYVESSLNLQGWGHVVAFLGTFLIVYVLMKIIEKALKGVVETIHLQNLDKALGLFLGCLEGIAAVGFLIFLLSLQPFVDLSGPLGNSFVASFITPLVAHGLRLLRVQ